MFLIFSDSDAPAVSCSKFLSVSKHCLILQKMTLPFYNGLAHQICKCTKMNHLSFLIVSESLELCVLMFSTGAFLSQLLTANWTSHRNPKYYYMLLETDPATLLIRGHCFWRLALNKLKSLSSLNSLMSSLDNSTNNFSFFKNIFTPSWMQTKRVSQFWNSIRVFAGSRHTSYSQNWHCTLIT